MEQGRRSALRLLAPMALIAFALAFLFVVASSDVDDDDGSSSSKASGTTERERPRQRETTGTDTTQDGGGTGSGQSTYTVQTGDTLAGIADKTGVTIEKLQELNPELDPQALVSGQKIKLRE